MQYVVWEKQQILVILWEHVFLLLWLLEQNILNLRFLIFVED